MELAKTSSNSNTISVRTLCRGFSARADQVNRNIADYDLSPLSFVVFICISLISSDLACSVFLGEGYKKHGEQKVVGFGEIVRELPDALISFGIENRCKELTRFSFTEVRVDGNPEITILDKETGEQMTLPRGISLEDLDAKALLYIQINDKADKIIGLEIKDNRIEVDGCSFTQELVDGRALVSMAINGQIHILPDVTLNQVKLAAVRTLPAELHEIVLFCDPTLEQDPITQSVDVARRLFNTKQISVDGDRTRSVDLGGVVLTESRIDRAQQLTISFLGSDRSLDLPSGTTLYSLAQKAIDLFPAKDLLFAIFGKIHPSTTPKVYIDLAQMLLIYHAFLESVKTLPNQRDPNIRSARCADYLENNPQSLILLRNFFGNDQNAPKLNYYQACNDAAVTGKNVNHPYKLLVYSVLQPIPETFSTALENIDRRAKASIHGAEQTLVSNDDNLESI